MSFLSETVLGHPSERKVLDVTELLRAGSLGALSKAGAHVSEMDALRVAACFACVRVLAEDVAKLKCRLYLEGPDGRRKVAADHPLHWLLYRKPNDWQTPFEFRETGMLHAALTKGAFAYISRGSSGILELIPLTPGSVTIRQLLPTRRLVFDVSDANGIVGTFPRESILHVRGPSWNTYQGLALVRLAREVLGLSIAIEESQERFYQNGARPSGALTTEKTLSDEARKRLKALFEGGLQGFANTGKVPVLDDGLTFVKFALSSVDAQTLESRKLAVVEVCRMWRVNPQKVMHLEQSTSYSSAEQHNISHATDSIHPWVERWEQAIARDCLTEEEIRQGLYPEMAMQELLRGDSASRATYYKASVGTASSPGWNSPNDVRRAEGQDPLDQPGADEIVTVRNMTGKAAPPEASDGESAPPPGKPPPAAGDEQQQPET